MAILFMWLLIGRKPFFHVLLFLKRKNRMFVAIKVVLNILLIGYYYFFLVTYIYISTHIIFCVRWREEVIARQKRKIENDSSKILIYVYVYLCFVFDKLQCRIYVYMWSWSDYVDICCFFCIVLCVIRWFCILCFCMCCAYRVNELINLCIMQFQICK